MTQQTEYTKKSLIEIARLNRSYSKNVELDGLHLTISQVVSLQQQETTISFTNNPDIRKKINQSYTAMIKDITSGIPVYGTNTAFGGQADRILNKGTEEERIALAQEISKRLVFLDVSVGPEFSIDIIKSAMAIRLNMLLQGVSAVRLESLETIKQMINTDLIPIVHQYGGIGASGDLAHNQRIVSAARGLSGTYIRNKHHEKLDAKSALEHNHIPLLLLDPKEGLGLVNGDNFSSAVAIHIYTLLIEYYLLSTVVGSMVIEALRGSNRSFHPVLSDIRPHPGQQEVSFIYRSLLEGSKLAYQELSGHAVRDSGTKVQDGYSLRCIPQFEAVHVEAIKHALDTITININSVSDNPVWVSEDHVTSNEDPWQWVSGGNFLAMHMAEAMDQARKITTQLIKRNDRHLARLIDQYENNGLPPNLSDKEAITQCSLKGIQIQSGMFDVYSILLANPVTTLFGTHEERNQDVTSHALTSGILAEKNLELLRYSLAMNMIAVAQAIDLRGGKALLAPRTRYLYDWIRKYSSYVQEERPLHGDIETLSQAITSGEYRSVLMDSIFEGI